MNEEEKPKKKRRNRKQDGKVVRLSEKLLKYLNQRKLKKTSESYDELVRRLLGVRSKTGDLNKIRTYWVLTRPKLQVFDRLPDAKGQAVLNAVRAKKRQTEKPIKVKESL